MYWRLADSVTACIACDRVILLDVARDRYSALPPAYNDRFASWLTDPGDDALAVDCRGMLARLGIVDCDQATGWSPIPCLVTMPDPIDSKPLPRARTSFQTLVGVGRVVVSAWRDLRTRPLATVLSQRLSPARPQSEAVPEIMEARLAAFRTARPLVPVPRVCLHDCLALIDWLARAHVFPELVLGVTAYPFAAHSWVQSGGRLLDDHPESASRFQPILHFA